MIYNTYFSFDKIFTYDNYFKFFENYLRVNKITKADFLNKTNINAGTYRTFLKDISKHQEYYYGIIHKCYDIKFPTKERQEEISKIFNKCFFDFLLLKTAEYAKDLELLDSVITKEIKNLETIPFMILKTYLTFSNDNTSDLDKIYILEKLFTDIGDYSEILHEEFHILYYTLKVCNMIFTQQNYLDGVQVLSSIARKNDSLFGLGLSFIAGIMYENGDYVNAIIYAQDALGAYYSTGNYIRLINMKSALGTILMVAGNFQKSHTIFKELYYIQDIVPANKAIRNTKNLFTTYILIKDYQSAYEFYIEEDLNKIYDIVLLFEYIFILYKLNKKEELKKNVESISDKIRNSSLNAYYKELWDSFTPILVSHSSVKRNAKIFISKIFNLKTKQRKLIFNFLIENI